jgi:hypothetical protein
MRRCAPHAGHGKKGGASEREGRSGASAVAEALAAGVGVGDVVGVGDAVAASVGVGAVGGVGEGVGSE